jgi:hypothetical protein
MRGILSSLVLVIAAGVVLAPNPGYAACECRCVNGQVTALCESANDLRPICSPQICGIVPHAVRPVDPPRIPPIGTRNCRSEQVRNPGTGRYEWQEVCR